MPASRKYPPLSNNPGSSPLCDKMSHVKQKAPPFSFTSSQRSKKQRSVDCERCHMFSSCKHLFWLVCTLCMKTNRDCEFIWQIPGNCDLLRRSHRESWPLIGSCGLSRQTLNVRTRRVSARWPLCAAQQVTCDPDPRSDINRKSCSPRSFRWLANVRPHPIIPCESIPENQKWK